MYHSKNLDNRDFNPLPRKEGDNLAWSNVVIAHNFNPLPRKEGDVLWR